MLLLAENSHNNTNSAVSFAELTANSKAPKLTKEKAVDYLLSI
jgi:hypothetical protein